MPAQEWRSGSRFVPPRIRFRSLLRAAFVVQLVSTGLDWAICIVLAPCPARDVGVVVPSSGGDHQQAGEGEGEVVVLCEEEYALALLLRNGSMMLSCLLVMVNFCYRLARLLAYQHHQLPRWVRPWLRWLKLKQRADFWVAAASLQLFRETEHVLEVGNQITGLLLMAVLAVLIASNSAGVAAEYSNEASRAGPEGLFSCQGSSTCVTGALINDRLLSLNAITLVISSASFHTSPLLLWSRSMQRASGKVGSLRMKRLQLQPWLMSIAMLAFLAGICTHVSQNMRAVVPPSGRIVLLLEQAFTSLFVLFLIWRSMTLRDLATLLTGKRPQALLPTVSQRRLILGNNLDQTLWQRLTYLTKDSQFSIGELQEALLMIQLIVWAERLVSNTTLLEMILVYTIRAGLLLLMFAAREKETAPSDLGTRCHVNFGLVIKASALRAALQGRAPGRIPLYSATVHRMQETLAVSYRWQEQEKEVMPGLRLNMSPFQMDALANAIRRSGCRYVWLDKLSVPQDDSPMKEALLARMMGVYSSSRITLAIRTVEEAGSRYHQRAWTFQEFCSSSRLVVATERRLEAGKHAVKTGEDSHYETTRAEFQLVMDDLEPLWLREGRSVTEQQARNIVQKYEDISGPLHCLYPGDKLRALVPLLAQAPVESQQELEKLLTEIADASGAPAAGSWLDLLRDSQSARSICSARGLDLPSDINLKQEELVVFEKGRAGEKATYTAPDCGELSLLLGGSRHTSSSPQEVLRTESAGLIGTALPGLIR